MSENVAAADGQPTLAGEVARLAVGIDEVTRGRPRSAAAQAIGQMRAAVAAQLQHGFRLKQAIVADQCEPAAEHAGTAGVRQVAVALYAQRRLGLDDLDRV